jgi:phosphocarrier protein HPr
VTTARATICNKKGLHARAAAKLVNLAATFDAKIDVIRLPEPPAGTPNAKAGATSILSLLMLAAERGVEVELQAEGTQAEDAIAAIVALIERKFDESE